MLKFMAKTVLAALVLLMAYTAAAWYASKEIDQQVRQQFRKLRLAIPQIGMSEGIDLQPGLFASTLHTRIFTQTATPSIIDLRIDHLPLSGLLVGDIARMEGSIHSPEQEMTGTGQNLKGHLDWSGTFTVHDHEISPGNPQLRASMMDLYLTSRQNDYTLRISIPHLWQQNLPTGQIEITGLNYTEQGKRLDQQPLFDTSRLLQIDAMHYLESGTTHAPASLSSLQIHHLTRYDPATKLMNMTRQLDLANVSFARITAGPIHIHLQASRLDPATMQKLSVWLDRQRQLRHQGQQFDWNTPGWQDLLLQSLSSQPRVDMLDIQMNMPPGNLQLQTNLGFEPVQRTDLSSPQALLKKLTAQGTLSLPALPSNSQPMPGTPPWMTGIHRSATPSRIHFKLSDGALRIDNHLIMLTGTPAPQAPSAGHPAVATLPAATPLPRSINVSPTNPIPVHNNSIVVRCVDSQGHIAYTNGHCNSGDRQTTLPQPSDGIKPFRTTPGKAASFTDNEQPPGQPAISVNMP